MLPHWLPFFPLPNNNGISLPDSWIFRWKHYRVCKVRMLCLPTQDKLQAPCKLQGKPVREGARQGEGAENAQTSTHWEKGTGNAWDSWGWICNRPHKNSPAFTFPSLLCFPSPFWIQQMSGEGKVPLPCHHNLSNKKDYPGRRPISPIHPFSSPKDYSFLRVS